MASHLRTATDVRDAIVLTPAWSEILGSSEAELGQDFPMLVPKTPPDADLPLPRATTLARFVRDRVRATSDSVATPDRVVASPRAAQGGRRLGTCDPPTVPTIVFVYRRQAQRTRVPFLFLVPPGDLLISFQTARVSVTGTRSSRGQAFSGIMLQSPRDVR